MRLFKGLHSMDGMTVIQDAPVLETRSDSSYTDAVIGYIQQQASGDTTADLKQTAVLEIAAGLYGRAFASATVSPMTMATAGITPAVLELIGREVIRSGEIVFLMKMGMDGMRLLPASYWTLFGGYDPDEWEYLLSLPGPSDTGSVTVSAEAVVHCRYAVDPITPWRGLGPMQRALYTSNLAGVTEQRLSQEMSASAGYIMPMPDDQSDAATSVLRSVLANLKGRLTLTPTTRGGYGAGQEARPQQDWVQRRIGATPPEATITLRGDVERSVLAACGVPVELVETGQGTASREAYRRFLHSSVNPVAKLVEEELRVKLDTPDLSLNFDGLFASDLSGRARAFQSLAGAGLDLNKAAALSGLMEIEE